MVHSRFEKNEMYSVTEPLVVVQAKEYNDELRHLIEYIERYQGTTPQIVPIKSGDHLWMLKPEELILADVIQGRLQLVTVKGIFETNETLRYLLKRLANPDFIQVSKHAFFNLNHLISLSASFSGNLSARLTNQVKTEVSRTYVKELMNRLEGNRNEKNE